MISWKRQNSVLIKFYFSLGQMFVIQKHLRWTIDGPDSSYSCLEIHICWKVDSEAKIDPPIHTEYLRSGGAMILIFIVGGARAVISFCILSAIPGYINATISQNFPHFLTAVSWEAQRLGPGKSRLFSTLKEKAKSWKNSRNFSLQLFCDYWDIKITQESWFTLYRR